MCKKHFKSLLYITILIISCIHLSSCSKTTELNIFYPEAAAKKPEFLLPKAAGIITYGNELASIDASHTNQGYVMVRYNGSVSKIKLQITGPSKITYTYNLYNNYETFPLTSGDGAYSLSVFENIKGINYTTAFSQDINVKLEHEYIPYLYPNQYVNYNSSMDVTKIAQKLTANTENDLEAISNIYNYVIENIAYDYDMAFSVKTDYLPIADDILDRQKGICFDYAAVMTAMLRSQGIPTRLEIGYAGEIYHAWISIHTSEVGTINDVIKFDGKKWTPMDPTRAAGSKLKSAENLADDYSSYKTEYIY